MDKRQFLEQTIERVREIDVSLIIGAYISLPKRNYSGYLGLCPFHNDTRLGSFVVTPRLGIFKCFSCDAGGDAIKFVSMYKGINYVEAAFTIAKDEGVISFAEYDEYFSTKRYTKREVESVERTYTEINKKSFKPSIASDDVLDVVFSTFLDGFSLKDDHMKYLKEIRYLSDEVIFSRKYRSYPTPGTLNKLKDNLELKLYGEDERVKRILEKGVLYGRKVIEENSSEDMKNTDISDFKDVDFLLATIPGFYQYRKRNETVWNWDFPKNKGIIIPIRNAKSQIVGLQMRRDIKDEVRGRYFWFSSSFADFNDSFRYGTSSGSPMDVLHPVNKPNSVLFITEGRFKSEVIVDKIGSSSISVQGVSNWRNIDREIREAEKQVKLRHPDFNGYSHIYVAFDSDMSYKYQVYQQLKSMTDHLEEKMDKQITYLYWRGEDKGIDDLISNSKCKSPSECGSLFEKHEKLKWDEEFKKQINDLLEKKKVKAPKDLSQEDLKLGINMPYQY